MITLPVIITYIAILISSVLLRCLKLLQSIHRRRRRNASLDYNRTILVDNHAEQSKTQVTKTMVVLGSGGHTTEMIHLIEQLDPKLYSPVVYVVADSDGTSISRLKQYIAQVQNCNNKDSGAITDRWKGRHPVENESPSQQERSNALNKTYSNSQSMAAVHRLPRPREVHQSYTSSILPTLRAIYHTYYLLQQEQPDLILANGPGMCVPLIYLIFLFRFLGVSSCKTIFVESLCRVQTLSLSGKLVYPIVDQFVVHWPSLKKKYNLVNVCNVFVRHEEENAVL